MTLRRRRAAALGALAACVAFTLAGGAARLEAKPHAVVRSALPLVVIDTSAAIRDAPKITARMRFVRNPGGRLNLSSDAGTDYDGLVGIEIRGHTSSAFPKRSYSFETRDVLGKARDVSLAGLPRENDWILYASYNDKTLMRNVLALWTARALGRYASRTAFVEVILNGRYQGVYVLMERVKRALRRVRLDGRDLTGGYLLEGTVNERVRDAKRTSYFRGAVTGKPFEYFDPERKRLGDRRAAWIRRYVGAFERALYGRAFRDPKRGYRQRLDVAAAVDYVLVSELFKNQDAFQTSMFVGKGRGSGLVLGPVWDFDVSSGNSNYGQSVTMRDWLLRWRPWAWRLMSDPAFVSALSARWRVMRARGLVPRMVRRIDADALLLRGAQRRNFQRWRVLGKWVWPNQYDPTTGDPRKTYRAEVAYLRSWLIRRARWIDANLPALQARADKLAQAAAQPAAPAAG